MNTLLNLMLSNALVAAILFAILIAVRRRISNPAVLHLCLLLILVKLVTPAYWQPHVTLFNSQSEFIASEKKAVRPEDAAEVAQSKQTIGPVAQSVAPEIKQSDLSPLNSNTPIRKTLPQDLTSLIPTDKSESESTESKLWTISFSNPGLVFQALPWIWLTGCTFWLLLASWRILRFQRFLSHSTPASAELTLTAQRLAEHIGLKHVPGVEMIEGNISPLLWTCFGRARIILPQNLIKQLNDDEIETLLLHELVHYRRGDHRVRFLELLATGVYWWFPVLWWIRRELRIAEEACCDAWVVETLPDIRRSYAEVLVKAIGFVSQPTPTMGATGIGSENALEQRLTRIMCERFQSHISRRIKFAVGVTALVLLPFAPMLGQSKTSVPVDQDQQPLPTVAEILSGYQSNLQGLLPLEMTYEFHIQDNMNCIHEDRRQLEAKRQIAKLNYSDIKVDGKVIYDERTFPLLVGEMLRQAEEMEAQLEPDQIKARLAGRLSERSYFWSDGKSFQRRWAEGAKKRTINLRPAALSTASLSQEFKDINIISAIANEEPLFRVWFGVSATYSQGQGRVGDNLNEIAIHKTFAPLGVSDLNWPERPDWYHLDYYLTRPADQYRVVGWRDFRGRRTVLLDGFFAPRNEETGLQYRYRLWIDPERGYLPLRLEWANVNDKGEVVRGLHHYLDVLEIKSFANGYYPLKIEFQNFTEDSLGIQKQIEEIGKEKLKQPPAPLPPLPMVPGRKEIWEVTHLTPNQPMKREELAFEFPQGAFYKNDLDGKNYLAGKTMAEPKLASPPPRLLMGDNAPDLQVSGWLDGKPHKLSDFKGKVVALLFINGIQNADFANLPPEMQESLSQMTAPLKAVHDQYAKKGVVFVEVHSPGVTKAQIESFHQFRKFNSLAAIDQASDKGGLSNITYNGSSMDLALYIIGRDGKIAFSDSILSNADTGELYWLYAVNKLSIPLEKFETATEDEARKLSLKIMEFLINEQFDYALSGKQSPLLMQEK